jgi:hypothetical protein
MDYRWSLRRLTIRSLISVGTTHHRLIQSATMRVRYRHGERATLFVNLYIYSRTLVRYCLFFSVCLFNWLFLILWVRE